MRYRFIEDHRMVWPIAVQGDVLEVTRSGSYARRKRPAGERFELTAADVKTFKRRKFL